MKEELFFEPNEKLLILNILLVIYFHDKRYDEAMKEIETLLNDPEMKAYKYNLLLKQDEIRELRDDGLGRLGLQFGFEKNRSNVKIKLMQTYREFIGFPILIAIVLGLIVVVGIGTPLSSADQRAGVPIFSASPTSGAAPFALTFSYREGLESGNYSVSFGDGEISSIMSIRPMGCDATDVNGDCSHQFFTHTYAYAGTYTATLIKELTQCNPDVDLACIMTKQMGTVIITVTGRTAPPVSFTATPTSGEAPLTVKFSGSLWSIGYSFSADDDGLGTVANVCSGGCVNTITLVDQTYTYLVPGTYTATLKGFNSQSTAKVTVTGAIPNNGFITTTSGGPGYITFIVVGDGSYTIDTGDSNIHKDRIIDLSRPLQHKDPPFREVPYYYSSSGTRTAKLYAGHPCALDTSCAQSLPAPIAMQTITVPGTSSGVSIDGGSGSPVCVAATSKFLEGEITPKAWHTACGESAIYNEN